MIKLLVVADDLTGAIDTGVQFAKQGISTFVTFDLKINIGSLDNEIRVLVVDTESRHLQPYEAAARVKKIVKSAINWGVNYIYKKTDSTLRGNIGAELYAVVEASDKTPLAFIPAYPKAGRVTKEGYHYVDGIPVHETIYGKDPLDPVHSSFIPEIIESQTNCRVQSVNLPDIRSDNHIKNLQADILVVDCEKDDDLNEIGDVLLNRDQIHLFAGAAGFAELLPDLLAIPSKGTEEFKIDSSILVINGSLNKISIDQINYAEGKGVTAMTLGPHILFEEIDKIEAGLTDLIDQIKQEGSPVMVKSAGSLLEVDNIIGEDTTKFDETAKRIGYITLRIFKEISFKTLVVFGGDTLAGILKAMFVTGIRPIQEISPGTVLSKVSGPFEDFQLVSKSGGFGELDIIFKIIDYKLKKDI